MVVRVSVAVEIVVVGDAATELVNVPPLEEEEPPPCGREIVVVVVCVVVVVVVVPPVLTRVTAMVRDELMVSFDE